MSKKIFRFMSVLLALSIIFSGISLQITTAFAEDAGATGANGIGAEVFGENSKYNAYRKSHADAKKATNDISVDVTKFTYVADAENADKSKEPTVAIEKDSNNNDISVVVWENGYGEVTWEFNVTETALYNLEFIWDANEGGTDVIMGVLLDGAYPFDGCDEVVLSRIWNNKTKKDDKGNSIIDIRTDAQQNEYAPQQVEKDGYITTVVRDYEGAVVDPFEFYLTAGKHTITVAKPEQSVKFAGIVLSAPEVVDSYSDYYEATVNQVGAPKDMSAEIIYIEGENAIDKTSSAIIPKSNNSDAGMTSWDGKASDPYRTKINYIGGTSWQSSGSRISWKFEVKEAGYYNINIRYKQSDLVNGQSSRWIKIDGKTPFEEAKKMTFDYGTSWEYSSFADGENNPYYVYLTAGKHVLSMEVTVAGMTDYFDELYELVDILNEHYIDMVMITGESPDINRDYELDKQIPDFIKTLKDLSARLGKLSDAMTGSSGQASQAVASINNMKRVVDNMIKSPFIAQQYISEYYSTYTSLSSWLYDMIKMPLAIDQIQMVPYGKEYDDNNANFFEKVFFGTLRLISSFTSDYSLTGDSESDANTIRLWVNWGQDQAAVLNSMIQTTFTSNPEKYGYDSDGDGVKEPINVQVEIVNASLINGILAGNFPDVSLQMARTEPVNLGIRGALADLRQVAGEEDFNEVIARFQNGTDLTTGAVAPYTYNGKTYALPDTQNFMLMYYRDDILQELGLEEPKTWDDFLYCATIIQRKNMNVYVPYTQITTSTTVNAGIGNLHLFPTLMWQHGLNIYNENGTATAINTPEALDVFEKWTDFYMKYDFLKEADFYNRLRVGVMPLGIAPYTTYMTLYSTAPEIRGRWKIAKVPGTDFNGNGVIDEDSFEGAVAGSGTGCAIIEKSDKKQQAWQFLKWWTSADTQREYNNNLQSILGMIGRTAVSNVEAFNGLAWDSEDREVLVSQWSEVKEVQEVPGSYDVTRSIDQAFWAVLEDDARVKDAVTKWAKSADKEIARKLKEYPNS